MKIKVVTVGKLKEKYLKDGIAEYSKRISRFAKLEMIELADEKTPDRASESENQKILEIEGQRILSKVGDRDFVIALAIEGKTFSSEEFSKQLEEASIKRIFYSYIYYWRESGVSTGCKKESQFFLLVLDA